MPIKMEGRTLQRSLKATRISLLSRKKRKEQKQNNLTYLNIVC